MRITVVSSLYPPNFNSGATLQAQRLARGLAARGHDVRVFAGERESGHEPLHVRSEVDEAGVHVTWLTTTPWFAFADPLNHINPGAEQAFADFLSSEPPDVVHLHVLQALGGGLVRVAAEAGARVVVTMHDLWWICARQFLADREMRPCCPVVDAGVCPCEVDHGWLMERKKQLAEQLSRADLILAPSAPAAEALRANGVGVVEVDENGLPDGSLGPGTHDAARPSGDVRFLYLGGPNPLKGAHLVVEAAHLLRDRQGWTMRAFGLNEYLVDHRVALTAPQVSVHDAFQPDEASSIFRETDVLVLPSVARESYSIATREALSQGIPVLTSDCLGPEEVVEHGRNGLVFRSGDAPALAATMRRVIDEPGLLDRLRSGVHGVSLRSLSDQVEGLERRYSKLLTGQDRQSHGRTDGLPVRRVLFVCGIDGAPLRYRVWLPVEALALRGIRSEVRYFTDPDLEDRIDEADALIVYRVPATPRVMGLLDRARTRGIPRLFDVDDLIFDPDLEEVPSLRSLPPAELELWREGVARYRTTMQACDAYVGSTDTLCERAISAVGLPAHRFPNGVGIRIGQLSDAALRRPRSPGPPRVGYLSGTTTHDEDWALVEDAVVEAIRATPGSELWLVGHIADTPAIHALGGRVRRIGFQHWEALPSILRDIDVNIAPLVLGMDFNEAKSAIKWLEAALSETPTVASPTQPFKEAITHGANGMLASTHDEWQEAITSLLADPTEAKRMAAAARRTALHTWSPHLQGERYVQILRSARAGPPQAPTKTIPPVLRDEPIRPLALISYRLSLALERASPREPSPPIGEEGAVFEVDASWTGVGRLDLMVGTYGGPGVALTLSLVSPATGQELARSQVDAEMVADNAWVAFRFPALATHQERVLARVRPSEAGKVAVWLSGNGPCVRIWREPDPSAPAATPSTETEATLASRMRFLAYLWRSEGPAAVRAFLGRWARERMRSRIAAIRSR